MGNTMGKKRKLGSSMSSKRYGGVDVHSKKDVNPLGRSYSMPVHQTKPKNENYHVVALTSSTYGILKVDAPKDLDEGRTPIGKSRLKDGSGIEGLEQLRDLDAGAGGISLKWSEVEEILNKMKPTKGEVKHDNQGRNEKKLTSVKEEVLGEPETINMWELMEGLDDDARSPSPFQQQSTPKTFQQESVLSRRGRGLEASLSFSAGHSVREVDAPTLRAAIHADAAAERAWRPPQVTESVVAGKFQVPVPSPRPGSGKENSEPAKPYHRQASAAFALPAERPASVSIPSQVGVSSMASAVNSKSASSAKQPEVKKPVPTIWTQDGSAAADQPSSEQQTSFTSPFSFQTTTSSDESDDRIPPGSPLFDPELLASFERAIEEVSEDEWYNVRRSDADVASTSGSSSDAESPLDRQSSNGSHSDAAVSGVEISPWSRKSESETNSLKMPSSKVAPLEFEGKRTKAPVDPLSKFEKKCPPGGEDRVVLYITSLRGIRKTFEDCSQLKFILQGFNVAVDQRDVSIHAEFREELKELQGGKMVPVPRLYIKGHYIGGAEEVTLLHEEGTLGKLLEGLPHQISWEQCEGCGGETYSVYNTIVSQRVIRLEEPTIATGLEVLSQAI
ncbi:hypothetical protein R1sor_027560 [Riccia sorocarpa]|uniref:Glutaredoxin domain-containing protein n=1 Tax=Riccia sorocarpa TaxID=122646 RepID=A0ABD3GEI5_9MARC